MNKITGAGVAGLVVVGGLYIGNKLEIGPECARDPSFAHCGIDGVGKAIHAAEDALKNIPKRSSDFAYTSNVGGGTVQIRTTEEDWPLTDRLVRIDPFEIKKGSHVDYSATSLNRVTTSMIGKLVSISFPNEDGSTDAYIMAVDDKGTPDKTDDKLVPINENNFKMVSRADLPIVTYPTNQKADYDACVANLTKGGTEQGGCVLSGVDDHNKAVDPTIINNLYQEYLGDEQDVVDTLHIASNVVLGNKGPNEWNKEYPETIRTSQITAVSIDRRMSEVLNLDIDHVHPIMAEDASGKPIERDTTGHGVDLTEVERLSNGCT